MASRDDPQRTGDAERPDSRPGTQRERFLIDARAAMRSSTGVGSYVRGIAGGFAALVERGLETAESTALVLLTASWKDPPGPDLDELVTRPGIEGVHRRIPVRLLNLGWHRLRRPTVERLAGRIDVAHSPHPLLTPTARAARVVTVHDLYFLDRPDHSYGEVRRDYPRLLWRSLRGADAVVCVSRATADDLRRRLGERDERLAERLDDRIHVVANGVDPFFLEPTGLPANVGHSGQLLAVGRIEPRKNPYRILEAFARTPPETHLAWAGMPADPRAAEAFRTAVRDLGLTDRVRVLGYVPRQRLRQLYREARGLVFPSLHEGFGLPILEAMACGCPVLTSNVSAMPEVAGGCAVLVDPVSVDAIARGLEELDRCADDTEWLERGRRHARSFSWEAAAEETLGIYRRVAGERGRERAP